LTQVSLALVARQRAISAVTWKSGLPRRRTVSSMEASAPWRSSPLRRAARSEPSAVAPRPAAVGPESTAPAIASQAPSRFSTKSNQSPPTS
jgi:hypothetical protein